MGIGCSQTVGENELVDLERGVGFGSPLPTTGELELCVLNGLNKLCCICIMGY
jgi:hypothetical protein